MKHEAFVDAVTMLDDDIIAEAQEPFRRKSRAKVIGFCSAAAACAAVIGAVQLLPAQEQNIHAIYTPEQQYPAYNSGTRSRPRAE